jgi:hypothetical protein
LLQEGREVVSVLCNIDEEHGRYTYASRWFNVFYNGLDNFGLRLTLDNVVAEEEVTKAGAGCSRAIDEPRSSSRRCRRRLSCVAIF